MQREKIILYIGGFELPDKNAAAQRVIANGKIMRSLGYKVIYMGLIKSKEESDRDLFLDGEYEGFSFYSTPYPVSFFEWIKYLSGMEHIHKLNSLNISHVVAYNCPAFLLWRLKRFCAPKKIKLIADCTEWYEPRGKNVIFRLFKKIDVSWRMKILHPKLHGIIVISDYLEEYYKKRGGVVINLPPLVDLSVKKWQFISEGENLMSSSLKLIYAGSPGSGGKDRLDKVMESLSIIKEKQNILFDFLIIGITLKEYESSFKDKIPENIRQNVAFLGRLPHVEVLNLVHNSHYQIFIRDNNLANKAGFPTKFVEAISCGTPVISNDSSNLRHYLIPGKTGYLLQITTKDELVDSLTKAMSVDRNIIQEMKQYCETSKLFDYSKYINKFDLFFSRINET